MPLTRSALFATLLAAGCAAAPRPFRLRQVVLHQNGVGYFERSGGMPGEVLELRLRAHEVDDVLKTLTVIEGTGAAATGRPGVAAVVPQGARGSGADVSLAVHLGRRPAGEVFVAYAVPTPTWRATYRIVLPDRRGRGEALLQSWALVNNVSNEDWRDVRLTLVTGGPLSFAVDLTTPRFVARPDVTGRLVEPVLAGAVVSEQTRAGRDGDAIADEDDECPDEPEDIDGWEDGDGCPDSDDDHDRIPDVSDACPRDAEAYNGVEDDDGCPDRGQVVVVENRLEILDKVYFDRESSEVGARSRPIVEAIAATLRGHAAIRRVEVGGHAAEGEPYPWGVSAARARAVRDALVASGVETERLEPRPYGDTRPIAPAATEDGRARNRRVELRLLDAGTADRPAVEGAVRVASLERSARAGALAREVAGGTRYALDQGVSIPAGSSTLVSIVNRRVRGEEVLLFRPGDDPRHPLRAARIENDTGLDFASGPVALFSRGAFVGEGVLDPVHAGEVVYVPFALDRSTAVAADAEREEAPVSLVSAARGVVTVQNAAIVRTRYRIDAGDHVPGRLFLRHARAAGHDALVLPPGTEKTADAYLVPLPIVPGRPSVLTIEERRPVRRTVTLGASPAADLAVYAVPDSMTAEQRERLRRAIDARAAAGTLERRMEEARRRLSDSADRSAELRESLEAIEGSGAAAAALRRQLLDRLREAAAASDELSRSLAFLGLEHADARSRMEEAIGALEL